MLTTIIKCNPGQQHGRLRGYTITQVVEGKRVSLDVIALNGRAALDAVRAMASNTQRQVAA